MGRTLYNSRKKQIADVTFRTRSIIAITAEIMLEQGRSVDDVEAVVRMFDQIWHDAKVTGTPILQMCEDETGIELNLDGEGSYHDHGCLNFNNSGGRRMNPYQQILVNNKRSKWMPVMCLSAMVISLNRVFNLTMDELSDYVGKVNQHLAKKLTLEQYTNQMLKNGVACILTKESSASG